MHAPASIFAESKDWQAQRYVGEQPQGSSDATMGAANPQACLGVSQSVVNAGLTLLA